MASLRVSFIWAFKSSRLGADFGSWLKRNASSKVISLHYSLKYTAREYNFESTALHISAEEASDTPQCHMHNYLFDHADGCDLIAIRTPVFIDVIKLMRKQRIATLLKSSLILLQISIKVMCTQWIAR